MSELKKELSTDNGSVLDECLPVKLKYRFQELSLEFQVTTVTGQGWTGIKNGKLLEKAQHEFDVFITIDQNLSFQQELSDYSIAVVVLQARSNRYKDLLEFVGAAFETLKTVEQGKFYEISPKNE